MTAEDSLMAEDHGLYLETVADALDVIGSGLPSCIFTESEVCPNFFDLRNGIAGEVFQKFVNYNFRVAFIIPSEHRHGTRVSELIRDHKRHSSVRFFESVEDAVSWLQ